MVTINPADFAGQGLAAPSVLSTGDVVRLYVEADLGIPLAESMIPASAERDAVYAEALVWLADAKAKGIEYSFPIE